MCLHWNTYTSMTINGEDVKACVDCGTYIWGNEVFNVSTGSILPLESDDDYSQDYV